MAAGVAGPGDAGAREAAGRVFDVADVAGERMDAWLFGRLVGTLPAAVRNAARFAYAAWCRAERPEEFVAFHLRAARVFEARGEGLDAVYHLFSGDPDVGIAAWADAFDRADAPDRAALARVVRLPEIWAWLPRQGRVAWSARAGAVAGGASAIGLPVVAHQHTQSMNQTQKTETAPAVTAADRCGAQGRGGG